MTQFFEFVFKTVKDALGLVDGVSFEAFGVNLTMLDVCIGFLAMAIIINVFWKGARA